MKNTSKQLTLVNQIILNEVILSFIQKGGFDGFVLFDVKNKTSWLSNDLVTSLGYADKTSLDWQNINNTIDWEGLTSFYSGFKDHFDVPLKKRGGKKINATLSLHIATASDLSTKLLLAGVKLNSIVQSNHPQEIPTDLFSKELNEISKIGFWKLSVDGNMIEWIGFSKEILESDLSSQIPVREFNSLIKLNSEKLEFAELLHLAFREGLAFETELTINTYKGNEKRIQLIGKIHKGNRQKWQVYGFIRDISEEHRQTARSKISEEQFKLAFDQASIGMALVSLEGRCLRSNISLSKILGYTQHELRSIHINDISLSSDKSRDKDLYNKLVTGEMDSYMTTKRFRHKLQHEVIVFLSVTVVRHPNHKPNYFFYQFNDISNIVKAEKELNKTKEQLELVIKGSQDGWWDWDLNNEQPFYSARWFEMLGYPAEPAIISREMWQELLHPDDKSKLEKYFTETVKSTLNKYSIEFRLKHKDGHYLTIDSRGFITRDAQGKAIRISGTDSDISTELERQRRYEAIFNSSFQFTGLLQPDGTVLEANETLIKFARTDADKVIGKKLWETPAWPDNQAAIDRLKESVEIVSKGQFDRFSVTTLSLDGEEIIIDFSMKPVRDDYGKVVLLIPEGRNVTAQIKTKSDLESSEARWKYALEGSGDGVWDWQLVTNEIYFSPNWKRMLGYEPEELENKLETWRPLVHPEDLANVLTQLYNYIDGKEPFYVREYRIRCKDNTYKWVLDRGKIVEFDENGKATRMIGTHTDINNQKLIEKQLRETINIVSNQNNRLLNFAHIVSHNLRSHAGNIETVLNFIETETDETELKELFAMIRSASDQLTETIHNLNEVVAIQTNINEEKSKRPLLAELIKMKNNLRGLIKETDTIIEIEVDEKLQVNVIPPYLDSILLNLMTNAIKYRSPSRKPLVKIRADKTKTHVKLDIIDNGLGIDMRLHKNKVFGMYKTFHGNKDARGIGLFITKNQVEAMGGQIDLRSEVGVGSIFTILLPLD